MLRNIYNRSDFDSCDADPTVPPAEKLSRIVNAPVTVTPMLVNETVYDDVFTVALPFGAEGDFYAGTTSGGNFLLTEYVNVGDEELYGHGIGTRLLQAATRFATERNPNIDIFTTGWARLGLVNTAVKVFGTDNVAVVVSGTRYGWKSEKALDSVFDDHPIDTDRGYLVNSIEAQIDHDVAASWESPIYALPTEA